MCHKICEKMDQTPTEKYVQPIGNNPPFHSIQSIHLIYQVHHPKTFGTYTSHGRLDSSAPAKLSIATAPALLPQLAWPSCARMLGESWLAWWCNPKPRCTGSPKQPCSLVKTSPVSVPSEKMTLNWKQKSSTREQREKKMCRYMITWNVSNILPSSPRFKVTASIL